MNETDFLRIMREDILDTDMELNMMTNLEDVQEWDSLSFVSFVGMAKSKCGKKLDFNHIHNAKTISDLYGLLFGE